MARKTQKSKRVTTKKPLRAQRSVRTKKSANHFVTPFRKGSIREKACIFLRRKRSYGAFYMFMLAHGADVTFTLRYFRKLGILREEAGKVWVEL